MLMPVGVTSVKLTFHLARGDPMPLASQRPVRNRIGLEHQAADLPLSNRPIRATQGVENPSPGSRMPFNRWFRPPRRSGSGNGDTVWHLCVLKRNGLCMKCRTVAPDDPCPSSFVAVDDEVTPEMKRKWFGSLRPCRVNIFCLAYGLRHLLADLKFRLLLRSTNIWSILDQTN